MSLDKFKHFPEYSDTYITNPSQARSGIHVFPDKLYVVCTIFNPLRFRSRYWNYDLFEHHIVNSGAILYTVEIAFGDREFEVTDPNNHHHLQLRTTHEIWHKEKALNILINKLPLEAKYIAWIDTDVKFTRPDWAQETLHLLQHYDMVQMFSHAQDIGPNYEPLISTPGYAYTKSTEILSNDTNKSNSTVNDECYYYGKLEKGKEWKYRHPGFAWAARRESLDSVGGLVDWALLGSGDWIMSSAIFGEVDKTFNSGYSQNYKKLCKIWEERAERYIRRNIGYVPGTIIHYYHGEKSNRNYDTRWKLLVNTQYDPLIDIKPDTQGLYQLVDHGDERSIRLRDGLRKYAKLRNEDSNNKLIVP